MARSRITISLDGSLVDVIKEHSSRAGMDVSAYLVNAATRQIAEAEAAESRFTAIDALISEAEAQAAALPPLPAAVELTEAEKRDVQAALELVYGTEQASERHEAA